MRRNPRTPKTQKMAEEEVSSDTETSDNSTSDEPKTSKNEPTDYEKQRQLRISQNRARMEAMGLQKIANSLMDLGHKKSQLKSKRVVKNGKEDHEYVPNDDEDQNDDSRLSSSSEEFEPEKKKVKKKKNVYGRASGSHSARVEPRLRVLIPDSSLQFTGHCGEKVCVVFPKASEKEVKELMDSYPKGFNGFNREQAERVLRCIAGLKTDYWKLRRLHVKYPEFREELVEGLPFPEGFNGFNLEESKQISGVIVALEAAYLRLRKLFESDGAVSLHASVHPEASASRPLGSFGPPSAQVLYPQQQASTFAASPVPPNAPMFPGYWCPPMGPYGMFRNPWNACNTNFAPYMGNYPAMPYFDTPTRDPSMRHPLDHGSS